MADIQHRLIADAELHEPKGVVSANTDEVYSADGVGSGSWGPVDISGIGAANVDEVFVSDGVGSGDWKLHKPKNTVVINDMSDFPAPAGGVITLEDYTAYVIGTNLTTSDRFQLGVENVFSAVGGRISIITYTGAATLFTGSGASFTGAGVTAFSLDHVGLSTTTGQILDLDGTGAVAALFIDDVLISSSNILGTLTNISVLATNRCTVFCNQGFTYVDTEALPRIFVMSYWQVITSNPPFIFLDLDSAVFSSFLVDNVNIIAPSGAIGFKGLTGSANIVANTVASVNGVTFDVNMTPLSGISENDIRWEFNGNGGVRDSRKCVETYLLIPETTTITTTGVFVPVGGTNWLSDIFSRFTMTSDGEATYISEVDATFFISVTASVEKVGGGADQIEARIAKNGTTLPKSGSFTTNSTSTMINPQSLVDLTLGDTIQLYVANNTLQSNIITNIANLTAVAT